MGIGRTNKKLREALIGKDLADPAQREEVRATLEDFANAPNRSEKLRTGVENFLSQPMFMEQMGLDLQPRREPTMIESPTGPVGPSQVSLAFHHLAEKKPPPPELDHLSLKEWALLAMFLEFLMQEKESSQVQ
jgi:hypothetical protein